MLSPSSRDTVSLSPLSLFPKLLEVASILHKEYLLCHIPDNGLNGDLLSEDERSGSELGEDGEDSMDSDRVGALNLVTSSDRLASQTHPHSQNNNTSPLSNQHNHHHHHRHPSKNGNSGVNSQSNGHGQLSSPTTLTPSAASVQAALAALQAGQLSLNQVKKLFTL